jgi:hypothetical protein
MNAWNDCSSSSGTEPRSIGLGGSLQWSGVRSSLLLRGSSGSESDSESDIGASEYLWSAYGCCLNRARDNPKPAYDWDM